MYDTLSQLLNGIVPKENLQLIERVNQNEAQSNVQSELGKDVEYGQQEVL